MRIKKVLIKKSIVIAQSIPKSRVDHDTTHSLVFLKYFYNNRNQSSLDHNIGLLIRINGLLIRIIG